MNQQISILFKDTISIIQNYEQSSSQLQNTIQYIINSYRKKLPNNGEVVLQNESNQSQITIEQINQSFIPKIIAFDAKDQKNQNNIVQFKIIYDLEDQEKVLVQKFKFDDQTEKKTESVEMQHSIISKLNQSFESQIQNFENQMIYKREKVGQDGKSQALFFELSKNRPELKEIPNMTLAEVKLHKTEQDAWTIVRQKVYDVTHYLNCHPGGKEKLMQGIGKDSTSLFDKYHPWVNAHFLLEKWHIGNLK